jgi:hypothetical protein
MRRGDPKSLSDEELLRLSAKTRIESRLEAAGCLGVLAAFVLLILLAFTAIFTLPFAVAAAGAATALGALYLAGLPKRAFREELDWRRGKAPLARYMDEARSEFARGADWTILFTRRGLPHGLIVWLRITVIAGPPAQAKAAVRASAWALPDWRTEAGDTRVEAALADEAARELRAMLSGLDPASLTDVPSFVRDGAPCELAILRPGAEGAGSCNLGGLSEDQHELPTAAFCLKLAGIAQDLLARA